MARCLVGVTVVALFSGCATPVPPPSYASYFDRLPCVDRIGRCFDARVAGQPVIVIADKTRHDTLTAIARRASRHIGDVYWEVKTPVDGEQVFDVEVGTNALGREAVGEPTEEPELTVFALDGQDLASKSEQVANQHVRVNGQPVITQQKTLTRDFLPPGRYVIAIHYRGQHNWERKSVFVTVR